MTKIVHLSTTSGGGGGIAAKRLSQFLINQHIDSKMVTLNDFNRRPYTLFGSQKLHRYCKPLLAKLLRYEFVQDRRYEIFSTPFSKVDIWKNEFVENADVIHIHWTSEFLDWKSFFSGIGNKKIVWTLHDMNPFTGGCHHADECAQYINECESCPQLEKSKKGKLVKELFEIKEEALSHLKDDQLIVVGVSKWITELSQSSRLLGRFKHVTLPNPIDERIFKPIRTGARPAPTRMGNNSFHSSLLTSHNFTILFSAPDINNPRKGFSILLDALKLLDNESIRIVAMGKKPKNMVIENVEFVGHISSMEELNHYYNDVDLFVTPSKIESFGLTVAESLLAGTPVVGFNVGGVGEMIVDGENGFLAHPPLTGERGTEGVRFLVDAILKTLHHDFNRDAISKDAQKRFGAKSVIDKYVKLYERVKGEV